MNIKLLQFPTLFILGILLPIFVGCRPEPAEVESAAMTEGETLAEDGTEASEVSVAQGGPAAWSCQRYLDFSDETSEHFDPESAQEAEEFADSLFRAAERNEDGVMVRPDVPLRTALRDACAEQEDTTLADVLNETFGEGAA